MPKRKKMTWKQNLDYHTRMYARQRPDIHPVTEIYHHLCMKRAKQHIDGNAGSGNEPDLRHLSSRTLFGRAINIFNKEGKIK